METSSKLFIEEVFTFGLAPHVLNESKNVCQNVFNSIRHNQDLKSLLDKYILEGNNVENHLFLTAFYTAIIAQNIEWITEHSRNSLIMGAFLHDIGKVKLTTRIKQTPKDELSEVDLEEYKRHPEYGVELLDEVDGMSEQIKQIIYQHHELNTGAGFPSGLTSTKIFPLAKIVAFANFLSNKSLNKSLSPFDTIKKVIEERKEIMTYEPFVVKAFIKGFVKGVE